MSVRLIGNIGTAAAELDKMNLVLDRDEYFICLVLENGTKIILHEFFDDDCDILFDIREDSSVSYISKFFAEIFTKAELGNHCIFLDEIQKEVFPVDDEDEDEGEIEENEEETVEQENQRNEDDSENRLTKNKPIFSRLFN